MKLHAFLSALAALSLTIAASHTSAASYTTTGGVAGTAGDNSGFFDFSALGAGGASDIVMALQTGSNYDDVTQTGTLEILATRASKAEWGLDITWGYTLDTTTGVGSFTSASCEQADGYTKGTALCGLFGIMTGALAPLSATEAFPGASGGSWDFDLTVDIGNGAVDYNFDHDVSAVPLPAAAWLFGSAVLGLAGVRRRQGKR